MQQYNFTDFDPSSVLQICSNRHRVSLPYGYDASDYQNEIGYDASDYQNEIM